MSNTLQLVRPCIALAKSNVGNRSNSTVAHGQNYLSTQSLSRRNITLNYQRYLSLKNENVRVSLLSSPLGPWRDTSSLRAAAVEDVEVETADEEVSQDEDLEYYGNDDLIMYFKAEGTMPEAAGPKITKGLEAVGGVSNVKVYTSEGCATVECTKVTTVQATGVASGLVDLIQKQGFKMQNLFLGFDDEDEADPDYFSFKRPEFTDDENAQRSA